MQGKTPRNRLVIDTNCLIRILHPKSPYYILWELITLEEIELCVSTEILLEYEEIIQKLFGVEYARTILNTITRFRNTIKVNPYYKYVVITKDYDDNKFIDVFFAGGCNYLITNDSHFKTIKNDSRINAITLEDYIDRVKQFVL